jgi:hypothetical protein
MIASRLPTVLLVGFLFISPLVVDFCLRMGIGVW